jgi:hypothetical protein
MRRVGWNIDGFASTHGGFPATERCFDLSVKHNKRFIEVVAMRTGAPSRRDMHVDDAKAIVGVLPGDGYGVSIADETHVGHLPVVIRLGKAQIAIEIVGR